MDPQFGNVVSPSVFSPELHQIRRGDYAQECTAHDFLTHMPGDTACQEFTGLPTATANEGRLRVFWYPPTNYPAPLQASSLEDKIKNILSSLKMYEKKVLVQFWAPIQMSNGQIVLSISEQPFGLTGLHNGLCRYRYNCYHHLYKVRDITDLGPPGRVFTHGTHERCLNIFESYTNQEFPLREYAKFCGFFGYRAYPLFGSRDHSGERPCIGVLEFLSFAHDIHPGKLQSKDFVCALSHTENCRKIYSKFVSSHIEVLRLLYKEIKPFYHFRLWIPCFCEGSGEYHGQNSYSNITQLFSHTWSKWEARYGLESAELKFYPETFVVKNGKSGVGAACLLNKVCFIKDLTQISAFDYPIAPLNRSSKSVCCYAIPLKLIHPNLPPFILEAHVPLDEIWNIERELKAYLSKTVKRISKYDVAFELKQAEDFCVEFSHSDNDNYVYFDVYQRVVKNKNNKKAFTDNQMKIIRDTVQKYGGGEQVHVQSHEDRGLGMSSSAHDQDHADIVEINIDDKAAITLEIIKKHFGKNIADAADQLGVSRSTLKRRCRNFGIKRWPPHKKINKILQEEGCGEFDQKSMTTPHHVDATGKETNAPDPINTLTIRATYEDDVVKFPFQTNSCIEELCRGLAKRFKLGNDSFKIKYEDEGDWILISCDEDLCYHMNIVKSSGQTLMNLLLVLLP